MKHLARLSGRRLAAGIDIQPHSVRAVAMSCALSGCDDPCIEYIGLADLPAHAMPGIGTADASSVSDAVVQALGPFYTPRIAATLRIAMAIEPAMSLLATVPRDALRTAGLSRRPGVASGPHALQLDLLEPAVRAHAETLSGIERSALALDWWSGDAVATPSDSLTIAAASREHIDARIDVAAGAGLQLIAIDIESNAALRACRYDAAREISDDALYTVLWLGPQDSHFWLLRGAHTIREWQVAAYADIAEVLAEARTLCEDAAQMEFIGPPFLLAPEARPGRLETPGRRLAGAFLAGDLRVLADAGLTLDGIGAVLDCKVFEFDAACQCESRSPVAVPDIHPAAFAVAFGLALRAVLPCA